jgi:hypothetical protein
MPMNQGPKSPSRPTVKRLFAVSGNLCAFPKCNTPLVDPQSGSIVGEICHIKGDKKNGAARYDKNQSDKERQGFANLFLLCNVHHKIVDDDEVSYTVERLVQMKKDHEARHKGPPPVDAATAEKFVTVAITNSKIHGSVVTSHGQKGGQTAHIINNYHGVPPGEEPLRLECKVDTAVDLELIQFTGCPGVRFTVICRSTRPAKIHSAHLYVQGVDVMRGLQAGFGTDFGYTPVKGSTETLVVDLFPLTPQNSPEGCVLNRDDVCRFFCPLPFPPTMLALRAKPEQVSMGVQFFDGSDQTLLTGRDIQSVFEMVHKVYKDRPGTVNVRVNFSVKVKSKTLPKVDMQGKYNPHLAPIATPDPPASSPRQQEPPSSPKEAGRETSAEIQSKRKGKVRKVQNRKSKGTKKE